MSDPKAFEPKWVIEGIQPYIGPFRREFDTLSAAIHYVGWADGDHDSWMFREDEPENRHQVRDSKGFIV